MKKRHPPTEDKMSEETDKEVERRQRIRELFAEMRRHQRELEESVAEQARMRLKIAEIEKMIVEA
jgi:hypothetical protein